MKFDTYQTVHDIVNAVCSPSDLEELKKHITTASSETQTNDISAHLRACKEALNVYEQGFYRRWSSSFLQTKLEEQGQYAEIYKAEIRRRIS